MDDSISRRSFLGALGAGSLAPAFAAAQTFPAERIPLDSRVLWPWLRAQLVLAPGIIWLDTARFGPTLRAVMAREYRSRERESSDFVRYQAATFGAESIRTPLEAVGAFLGADPADLVLTAGTAEGLAIVAQGLDLQAGDEVLTTTEDHPAAVYPWLLQAARRNVKVVQLPPDAAPAGPEAIMARFAEAIGPKTRVVAFPHVRYTDGTVVPAREICGLARSRGVFSVVDGAQAPGLLDLRVPELGCDAYATCFHKWANGPYGTGALYLRRDSQPRLWPLAPDSASGGWTVHDRFGAPVPPASETALPAAQARFGQFARYRGPAIDALPIALELQQSLGRARLGSRVLQLTAYLRAQLRRLTQVELLTPSHPSLATGILAMRVSGGDHAALAEALAREDGIVIGHIQHGQVFDGLRVSLHPSNEADDIDRLVVALQRRL